MTFVAVNCTAMTDDLFIITVNTPEIGLIVRDARVQAVCAFFSSFHVLEDRFKWDLLIIANNDNSEQTTHQFWNQNQEFIFILLFVELA